MPSPLDILSVQHQLLSVLLGTYKFLLLGFSSARQELAQVGQGLADQPEQEGVTGQDGGGSQLVLGPEIPVGPALSLECTHSSVLRSPVHPLAPVPEEESVP